MSVKRDTPHSEIDVFLVNPPYLRGYSRGQRSPGVIKSGTMYYPYWLVSAAGVLEQNQLNVKIVDAPAENIDQGIVLAKLKEARPGLIVIETSTPSIDNDIRFAKLVKENDEKSVICLVGTHPSVEFESILSEHPEIDVIARKEYEYTLVDLARAILKRGRFDNIKGISFRSNGEIICNDDRDYIQNLDELPFLSKVYKKHLNIKKYFFSLVNNPMVMLITGRGCPNSCIFCVYPQVMHGKKYRFRSAGNVVEEFLYIQSELPEVCDIVIEDDTFTANQKRAREISELIIKKNIKKNWFANIRVNTDYETLRVMRRAGLSNCAVGFESGNQNLLDNMKKGINLSQSVKFMDNCKKLGINVHGCFMVGFPGENKNTLEHTFQFAKKLKCNSAQFYPIFLYPGTEAFRWAQRKNYLRSVPFSQWLDTEGGHKCVYDLPDLSAEEMMEFCEKAYKRYHLNPAYIARKAGQGILNPKEGAKSVRSGLNYVRYLLKNGNTRKKK